MNTTEFLKLAMVEESMAAAQKRKARVESAEGLEAGMEALEKALPKVEVGVEKPRIKLTEVSAEQKHHLVIASLKMTLAELVDRMEAHGIKTSVSALSRHLQSWRGEVAVEDGNRLSGAAEILAARGRSSAMREGALEALRQQMFEGVMTCNSREERMRLYELLAKEDERVKKLALGEKKAAMQERSLELQAARMRGGSALIVELLKLVGDQALAEGAKWEAVRERLERWKEGAIEVQSLECKVESGGKLIGEGGAVGKGDMEK